MPIGGADKRVAEVGKGFLKRGDGVFVLTTDEGRRVLADDGLAADFILTKKPRFWRENWQRSILGRLISYVYLTFFSARSVPNEPPMDIIYPSSDFFFDSVPALILKIRFKKVKLVGIIHHHLDLPWRRRGHFTQNLFLFISQYLGFLLFRFFDLILIPDNGEGELIKKVLSHYVKISRIGLFKNGVDYQNLSQLPDLEKRFEACFLGGFRPSKGIYDLITIWQEVIKVYPQAKLLVIGGGTSANEKRVLDEVSAAGLFDHISFSGILPKKNLFSFVKACRVFISPSYEEGWGIALLEAMACGLPAVVYDLSAYSPFGRAVLRVPLGNKKLMAQKVINLLEDDSYLANYRELGQAQARKFDWEEIIKEEKSALDKLVYA